MTSIDNQSLADKITPPLKGMRAMLFAAGLGTRLKPFTDKHPKALAPVNGKPLLQRNIEYLKKYGIEDFIINVHHFADQIETFLTEHDNFGVQITLSHEESEPLETGGGLLHASWFLADQPLPFLVMNADILTDLNLGDILNYHQDHNPLATLAVTNRKSSRNFLFNDDMILCGWINNSTGETRMARSGEKNLRPGAFTCVHIINPSIFPLVKQLGKFSIIDTYLDLARDHDIRGFFHNQDCVIDVGRPESIIEAEKYFKG
ncbi:MAG: nucleotidyltransferase family protein [Chitinophagaceae bacterium]